MLLYFFSLHQSRLTFYVFLLKQSGIMDPTEIVKTYYLRKTLRQFLSKLQIFPYPSVKSYNLVLKGAVLLRQFFIISSIFLLRWDVLLSVITIIPSCLAVFTLLSPQYNISICKIVYISFCTWWLNLSDILQNEIIVQCFVRIQTSLYVPDVWPKCLSCAYSIKHSCALDPK